MFKKSICISFLIICLNSTLHAMKKGNALVRVAASVLVGGKSTDARARISDVGAQITEERLERYTGKERRRLEDTTKEQNGTPETPKEETAMEIVAAERIEQYKSDQLALAQSEEEHAEHPE